MFTEVPVNYRVGLDGSVSFLCSLSVPVPVPEPRYGAEESWNLTPQPSWNHSVQLIPPHVIAGAECAVTGMCATATGDTARCQSRARPPGSDPGHSTEAHGPHLCTLVRDEAAVATEAGAAPQNHSL